MWKYKYVYKKSIRELLAECQRLGHPDEGCFELVQILTEEQNPDGGKLSYGYVAVLKVRGDIE